MQTQKSQLKFIRAGYKLRISIGGTGAIGEDNVDFLKEFGRLHSAEDVINGIQNCIDLSVDHVTTDVMTGFAQHRITTQSILRNIKTFNDMFGDNLDGITTYALEGVQVSKISTLEELYQQGFAINDLMESYNRSQSPKGIGGGWWEFQEHQTKYIQDRWQNMTPLLGCGLNSYSTIKNANGDFRVNNKTVSEWRQNIENGEIPTNFDTAFKFDKMLEIIHNFHYTGKIQISEELNPQVKEIINVFVSNGVGRITQNNREEFFDISDDNSVIQLDLMKRYLTLIAQQDYKI
jgi:coproporphyrinogen III oxidase-like Fe-S oxidoreductase